MKKLLVLGLLLSGMSVYGAGSDGRRVPPIVAVKPVVPKKCRECGKYVGGLCRCGQPAAAAPAQAASAVAVKPTPPPVAPKSKRPAAAQPAVAAGSTMPRVRTGGAVQQRWNPEGTTQAERDILDQRGAQTAEALHDAQLRFMEETGLGPDEFYNGEPSASGYDPDALAEALAAEFLAQDLVDLEAQDAALAQNIAAREQRDALQNEVESLQSILNMDGTDEQIAALNDQIEELQARILSLQM